MITKEKQQEIENTLWKAANKLRGSLDPSGYKDVVLGIVFLKYLSDRFYLEKVKAEISYPLNPNDRNFYTFWVPENARWNHIITHVKSKEILQILDEAFISIEAEKENKQLAGILPKTYSKVEVNWRDVAALISLFDKELTTGEINSDFLGFIYEYFLGKFAEAEGKKGGEFYTPRSVVELMVKLIRPFQGRLYDPCCGVSGMFVQAKELVDKLNRKEKTSTNISIYGQEKNATTWRLSKMNLAIRGIEANLGPHPADTLLEDLHESLEEEIDYILANPPFNLKEWGWEYLKENKRWIYGIPPKNNANYAWIQHMLSKLNKNGVAAFVLANGSLSTSNKQEKLIRQSLIDNNLVECIISLPDKLFYATGIAACIWIIRKGRSEKDILFINAEDFSGEMISRKNRQLIKEEIEKIIATYHNWQKKDNYQDKESFCASVTQEKVKIEDYWLLPNKYITFVEEEISETEVKEKINNLSENLFTLFDKQKELEEKIKESIEKLKTWKEDN